MDTGKKRPWADIKRSKGGYLWIASAFIIVSLAAALPLVFAFNYSLYKSSIFQKVKPVGSGQYAKLMRDTRFWINIFNSLSFTIEGTILALVAGFISALLIRRPGKPNSIYRTIILIPWVTNKVVLALMWTWVLNPQMSTIYYWSDMLGIVLPNFFEGRVTPLVTATVLNVRHLLGFSLVMTLTTLPVIPVELEDAAFVDGCSKLQHIWYVILLLTRLVALVMIIVLTMSFFNIVPFALSITGGRPICTTEILSIRLYKETFTFFNIPLSSALTTVMLVINLVFVLFRKKTISEEDYYQERGKTMSRKFMGKIIAQIALLTFVILTLVPFLWTISTSPKEIGEILSHLSSLLPKRVTLHNYIKVLTQDNFLRFMFNSTIVTVLSIAVTLLVFTFAGYEAARLHFLGKGLIMFMILTGMVVGRFVNAISMYFVANRLGFLDTCTILVFVYSAFIIPLVTWLIQPYYRTIPKSLEEAARSDGYNSWGTF